MRSFILIWASIAMLCFVPAAFAADWVTAPSWFTHSPETGQRVWQYAETPPVYHTPQARSVYRQQRSSLQVGDSADHYHVVDQYGGEVRPYGEWRYPFRPFSVPYGLWGPQPIGNGFGGGRPGFNSGFGGNSGIGSPFGPFGAVNGAGFPPPWNDGSYPDVRRQQLPPQGFNPAFNPTFNSINGNNNNPTSNVITNQPTNNITGNGNAINGNNVNPATTNTDTNTNNQKSNSVNGNNNNTVNNQ